MNEYILAAVIVFLVFAMLGAFYSLRFAPVFVEVYAWPDGTWYFAYERNYFPTPLGECVILTFPPDTTAEYISEIVACWVKEGAPALTQGENHETY